MIKISDKIIQLEKPNGIFIVFGEYDSEEMFGDFLEFIHQKLGAVIGLVNQHVYLNSAAITFPFGEATAICQGGIGCAIRVDPEKGHVVQNIVEICSTIK